jgi:magnesium-transporting ATPase (P-type)
MSGAKPSASIEANEGGASSISGAAAPGGEIERLPERDALAALASSPSGLSSEQARERLVRYGPNRLPELRRRSPLYQFLAQFRDFFAILLEVAGAITLVAYLIQGDSTNLKVAVAVFAVVLLNAVIGFVQEYRAERTAEALKRLLPARTRVLRDGTPAEIAAEELVSALTETKSRRLITPR